jgi:hypothetical protein
MTRDKIKRHDDQHNMRTRTGLFAGIALAATVAVALAITLVVLVWPGTGVGLAGLVGADASGSGFVLSDTPMPPVEESEPEPEKEFVSPDVYESLRYEQDDGITMIGAATPQILSPATLDVLLEEASFLESQGYSLGFVMYDLYTGMGLAYNSDERFYSASAMKGPYAASLISAHPEVFDENYLLLESVLVFSNNESYETLTRAQGVDCLRDWFLQADTESPSNYPAYTDISARDMARLWARNQQFFTSGDPYAEALAALYTRPNRSVIKAQLGSWYPTYSKGGWYYPGAEVDLGIYDDEDEDALGEGGGTGAGGANEEGEVGGGAPGGAGNPGVAQAGNDPDPGAVDAGIVVAGEGGSRPYLLVLTSNMPGTLERLAPLVDALNIAHDELISLSDADLVRLVDMNFR